MATTWIVFLLPLSLSPSYTLGSDAVIGQQENCPSGSHAYGELEIPGLMCCRGTEWYGKCACNVVPALYYSNYIYINLKLVFVKNSKEDSVLFQRYSYGSPVYDAAEYHSPKLHHFPNNTCDFTKLLRINFTGCSISELPDLNCLVHLDELVLAGNKIRYISNTTLAGLMSLRYLDISMNEITVIEPYAFGDGVTNLLAVIVSHNHLSSLDISLFLVKREFCVMNFSNNPIQYWTNDAGFQIDTNSAYRGGMVDVTNTSMTEFIDVPKLGCNLQDIGMFIFFGFDLRWNKWNCDCKFFDFAQKSKSFTKYVNRDYFDVTCFNPPSLRGRSFLDLVKKGDFDVLICNISKYESCPLGCHCYYQPSQKRTVINCTKTYHSRSLPYILPVRDNLQIKLPDNRIKKLTYRRYLEQTKVLDISNNDLHRIEDNFFRNNMKLSQLNLTGNPRLLSLPSSIQLIDPCTIFLDSSPIICDCQTLWIKTWAEKRNLNCAKMHFPPITCRTKMGLLPALELKPEVLDCLDKQIDHTLAYILASCLALLLIAASVVFHFRYELLIIFRRFPSRTQEGNNSEGKYHLTFSYNYGDPTVSEWVTTDIANKLSGLGYRIFLPELHIPYGDVRMETFYEKLSDSKHVLVVLSESYFNADEYLCVKWTQLEWQTIWKAYRHGKIDDITIVNFDLLKHSDISDPRLKAFVRLGKYIDFSDKENHFLYLLTKRLGLPNEDELDDFIYEDETEYCNHEEQTLTG